MERTRLEKQHEALQRAIINLREEKNQASAIHRHTSMVYEKFFIVTSKLTQDENELTASRKDLSKIQIDLTCKITNLDEKEQKLKVRTTINHDVTPTALLLAEPSKSATDRNRVINVRGKKKTCRESV